MYVWVYCFQIKISQVCLNLHAHFDFNIKLLRNHPVDLNTSDFVCLFFTADAKYYKLIILTSSWPLLSWVHMRWFSRLIVFVPSSVSYTLIRVLIHTHTSMHCETRPYESRKRSGVVMSPISQI